MSRAPPQKQQRRLKTKGSKREGRQVGKPIPANYQGALGDSAVPRAFQYTARLWTARLRFVVRTDHSSVASVASVPRFFAAFFAPQEKRGNAVKFRGMGRIRLVAGNWKMHGSRKANGSFSKRWSAESRRAGGGVHGMRSVTLSGRGRRAVEGHDGHLGGAERQRACAGRLYRRGSRPRCWPNSPAVT
jgi:hypothetical protein